MIYRIFPPHPALADIVECYTYAKVDLKESISEQYATSLFQGLAFNFNNYVEKHVHDGKTIELNKAGYVFGQSLSPRTIISDPRGIDVLAVKFKPLGIALLTGINMEHLVNMFVALDEIWGNEFKELCEKIQSTSSLDSSINILDQFFIYKRQNVRLNHRIENVRNALSLINQTNGTILIKELQQTTNTSRKTLERAFQTNLGIHPKLYSKIVRFNVIKNLLDQCPNQAEETISLALSYGYYDSSHFISEFRRFSAFTPQEYQAMREEKTIVKGI